MSPYKVSKVLAAFTLVVTIHSGICQNPEETSDGFEGDMLGTIPMQRSRTGWVSTSYRWPNATIPYVFEPSYRKYLRTRFNRATTYISGRTCLRFVPRTNEHDFIIVTLGNNRRCASYVGRRCGNQTMYLGTACDTGINAHELMHALGFVHEQSRPDRDDYVKILWENIKPGMEHNFAKYSTDLVSSYGVDYDYGSIMHYGDSYFAKDKSKFTIEPTGDPFAEIGQRKLLSPGDIGKINTMYC